jgi:saccharopine dehydrogenase (NADP+, L-glutamate forming)
LLALRNTARYYRNGKIEEIPDTELMGTAQPYFIYPGFAFVVYPNRDSTLFGERNNIPEAQIVSRGTLRYQGFPEFVRVLVDIGLLSEEAHDFPKPSDKPLSWAEATQKVLKASSDQESDFVWLISSKTKFRNNEEKARIIAGLKWIGLFSSDPITPRSNPLDTLCASLEKKMQYEPGERDMVMLQPKFEIEHKDGRKETRTSTFCDYGNPKGYSSMARLVGVPSGVACLRVLDGSIKEKGILAPVTWDLAEPLLVELREIWGIEMVEKPLV